MREQVRIDFDALPLSSYPPARWAALTRHQYRDYSLVLINGLLTSVGGYSDYRYTNSCTNSLLSLTGEGEKRQWSA